MSGEEKAEELPMNSSNNGDAGSVTHKILLVGGTGVGKTCIMRQFVDGEFPVKSKATLGLDFRIRSVQLKDKYVKLQLWDTSGQERFRSMTQSYYRGATGVMLVYDVTDEKSMQTLPGWLSDISNFAPDDVNIVLLANKIDLKEKRVIDTEAGREYARQNGMIYFETSAMENINIVEAFQRIAEEVSVMERYARQNGMIYFETSAMENINIVDAFQRIAEGVSVMERKRKDTISGLMQQISNDHITQPEEKKPACSC